MAIHKKKGKYSPEVIEKIITTIDTELSINGNFGADGLSDLRREYIDRFFRLPTGSEEEGFSTYNSPMIQDHVLQTSAYVMRPFNKSKQPVVDFGDDAATGYVNHVFRNILKGKRLLKDSAFNGALLKTMAVKVWVKPEFVVEEDYVIFEGTNKSEIEEEIDLFFIEDTEIEQMGEVEWFESEIASEAAAVMPQPVPAPMAPGSIPAEAMDVVNELAPPMPQEAMVEEMEVAEVEMDYKATVRFKKEGIERRPVIDVIPPYEFYISNQAPSQEAASVVGRVTPMKLCDLKIAFEEAPKLNGVRGEAKIKKFWEDLSGEYLGWTQQNEWYELWLKDNGSYYNGYSFDAAETSDSPARSFLVADVDIQMDPNDTGAAQWYNVIKVGDKVLSCEPVSQPSFHVGSLIPVGGRWLGLSVADLIWDEDAAVTNNMRAANNAVLQATYGTPIVDEQQVYLEDVINRAPDSVIRRKNNAIPKAGVPAIEWTQTPGLNGTSFTLIEKYQEFAGTSTGAGKFFQAHDRDNVASARVGAETTRMIENNSDLMLDDMSSEFWDFWTQVLLMLHNACIMGKASPESFIFNGEDMTVDPVEDLVIAKTASIQLVIGSNEEQKQADDARKAFDVITALEAVPSMANIVTADGKALIVAALLKSAGADEEDLKIMVNVGTSQDVLQSEEVQTAIADAVKQATEMAQAESKAQIEGIEMQMKQAKINAEVGKLEAETTVITYDPEKAAAKLASEYTMREQSQEKINNRKETDAANIGLKEEALEQDAINSDREYLLAKDKGITTDVG